MGETIAVGGFTSLETIWRGGRSGLDWGCLFTLPPWLRVWWEAFQPGTGLYLRLVQEGGHYLGIAPLQIGEGVARFIGRPDVADYFDFITRPGAETTFFSVLLDDLGQQGVAHLDLGPVRPDSAAYRHLVEVARRRGLETISLPEDVSPALDLPATFDGYLAALDIKQRHEIRRKMRRLQEEGVASYRIIRAPEEVTGWLDAFLRLFAESREDKARFLTPARHTFFRTLVPALAADGLASFGVLELDGKPTAMVLCFEYNGTVYLYNSGYDPVYRPLSAGLLAKVFSVRDAIARGQKRYDFLKGGEGYKYHLGGRDVPLYRLRVTPK